LEVQADLFKVETHGGERRAWYDLQGRSPAAVTTPSTAGPPPPPGQVASPAHHQLGALPLVVPLGWEERVDPVSKRAFYAHPASNTTQWEHPGGLPRKSVSFSDLAVAGTSAGGLRPR